MMAAIINRKQLKQDMKALLSHAQVSPRAMTALYLGIVLVLNLLVELFPVDFQIFSTFISILTSLLTMVLTSGFALYCMAIRRGERAEFLTLFDGFSFVGKIIGLNIVIYVFVFLWSMLFVIPGIVAAYRYRFALYDLYENPGMGIMEALDMSKRQTRGYKAQLVLLDLSYLGWILLASLPSSIYTSLVYQEWLAPGLVTSFSTASLPFWVWALLCGLWEIAVALFYRPGFQCVELGYFEIAKSTSGVSAASRSGPQSGGPDNMGGF